MITLALNNSFDPGEDIQYIDKNNRCDNILNDYINLPHVSGIWQALLISSLPF